MRGQGFVGPPIVLGSFLVVPQSVIGSGDIVLRVRKPSLDEVGQLKKGAIQVSYLDPYIFYSQRRLTTFAVTIHPVENIGITRFAYKYLCFDN